MTNIHHHLVLSSKDLVDSKPLEKWLSESCENYILSLEHGTNGHAHYDCFMELKVSKRTDSVKRSILRLYDIPKPEQKNVKVVTNTIDPNPMYGYGYSLKEGNIISSTFDDFEHADFLAYYESKKDLVAKTKTESKKDPRSYTVDDIADGCVEFCRNWFTDPKGKNVYKEGSLTQWHITQYIQSIRGKYKFSTIQRINREKLAEHINDNLVEVFLDSPPTQSPPLTLCDKIHPLL